jgi:hypothetical protein
MNHRHQREAQRLPISVVLLLALLAACLPAHAQKAPVPATPQPTGNCTHPDPSTRPDCPAAIAFLAKFQDALKRDDHPAVASLVHYPLLVTASRKRKVRTRAELLADFDHIFTASIRVAILNATADDVWGNQNGFMIGRGVIWFDAIVHRNQSPASSSQANYPFRLITVNPAYP